MTPLSLLTLLAYGLFVLLLVIDSYSAEDYFWTALLLQLTPLLLLLPGMLQQYYRSYSWLCFLILLYFTSYVVQSYASSRSLIDIIGLILSAVIFISAMFNSRHLQLQHFLHKGNG